MTAFLRGASRRGCGLLEGLPQGRCSNGLRSNFCLRDASEGTSQHAFAAPVHAKTDTAICTDFSSMSRKATRNVPAMDFSSFELSEALYKRTFRVDFLFHNGLFVCSNASIKCYHSRQFQSRGLALITRNNALELKTYGIMLYGTHSTSIQSLLQQRESCLGSGGGGGRNPSWTGRRSFSSLKDYESVLLDLSNTPKSTEAGTDTRSAEDVEDFDFRNFPVLSTSFFENYERPHHMEVRKKRITWQERRAKSLNGGRSSTLESIPKTGGSKYNFGLGNTDIKPPPSEAGARPQGAFDGAFDIDTAFDQSKVEADESSPDLLQRQSHLDSITSKTPGAGNGSEINQMAREEDFQTIEDGRLPDYEEDSLWDPFNVEESGLSVKESSKPFS